MVASFPTWFGENAPARIMAAIRVWAIVGGEMIVVGDNDMPCGAVAVRPGAVRLKLPAKLHKYFQSPANSPFRIIIPALRKTVRGLALVAGVGE